MSRGSLFHGFAFLALGLGASGLALSQPPASGGHTYRIQAKLIHGDRLVGAPGLIVREGEPATITVASDGGYSMHMVAHEQPANAIGRRIAVRSHLYLWSAGQWRHVATPNFTVPVGKIATMEVAAPMPPGSASGDSLKLEIIVTDAVPTTTEGSARACSDQKAPG